MTSRNWLFLSIILLAAGLGWIWVSRDPGGGSINGLIPAPRQGFAAPDAALQTGAGETVHLADYGGKPTILNVWASWCSPCRAEMPALQRLQQDYQARGLQILAVNSTTQDSIQVAQAFGQELGLSFPILYDTQGEAARRYQVRALPSTFFIDAHGVIREVVIGGPMSEALLRIRAESLLAASGEGTD